MKIQHSHSQTDFSLLPPLEFLDSMVKHNKCEYKNGVALIEHLEKTGAPTIHGIAIGEQIELNGKRVVNDVSVVRHSETVAVRIIDFFKTVTMSEHDVWSSPSSGFLRGRVHELVQELLPDLEKSTFAEVVRIYNGTIKQEQALEYVVYKENDRKLLRLFNRPQKFIEFIKKDCFVAGKLLERVRTYVHVNAQIKDSSVQNEIRKACNIFDLYMLVTNLIPCDNNSFFACIKYLKKEKSFNQILGYLSLLEDLPIELRLLVLKDGTSDQIIESIQNYNGQIEAAPILFTRNRKEQFNAVITKITQEWGCRETIDDLQTKILPDELQKYETPKVFYEELCGLVRFYQSSNKYKKLFNFLEGLYIKEVFLRRFILGIQEESSAFEAYRESLSVSEKHMIYQSLLDESNKISPSSSPTNSLSVSPPKLGSPFVGSRS